MERPSVEALHGATGRDWEDWFEVLDAAGGTGLEHRELVELLVAEHGLDHWWSHTLALAYQEERGLRLAGGSGDGSFMVSASKNLRVPVEAAYQAFADPAIRERWLPGAIISEESAQPGRSIRFRWGKAGARLNVGFVPRDHGFSMVGLVHERIPEATVAEATKAYWVDRLADLKALLERDPGSAGPSAATSPHNGHRRDPQP